MITSPRFSTMFFLVLLACIAHASDQHNKTAAVTAAGTTAPTVLTASVPAAKDLEDPYDDALKQVLSPAPVRAIIMSYLQDSSKLAKFTKLTDVDTLWSLCAPEFQTGTNVLAALKIAQRIYEVSPRQVKSGATAYTGSWGYAFPTEPEVLAYAMQLAKDEIILEIAGASGEHAIMLACAGAKQVYLNDMASKEIEQFERLKAELPDEISKRLEAVGGDCFNLVNRTDLHEKIGLIICRNLIHFFDDNKQKALFQLIKKLLKPGGRAFFTANTTYLHKEYREFFEKNPHDTCFATTQCLLTDLDKSRTPCARFFHDISCCADNLLEKMYTTYYIYEKAADTGYKWKANTTDFKKLDPALKEKVKKVCEENSALIKSLNSGTVRVLLNWRRLYNMATIRSLFEKHNFNVEEVYLIGDNGHIMSEDSYGNYRSIGIIIKRPENQDSK